MRIATTPATALIGTGVFFTGVSFASTLSYGAIAGIETLGIPNGSYAILLMVASVIGAIASVTLGYISDRVSDRRVLVIGCALMGALGFSIIYLTRSPLGFVIATAAIVPFGSITFSQTFGFARSYYNALHIERAEFMMSMLRTLFSIAWAIVPPIVGWIAATTSVFDVYGIGALAYLMVGVVYGLLMLDPKAKIGVERRNTGSGEIERPKAVVDRTIVAGAMGVVLILIATQLNGVTTPLFIVTTLHGSLGDIGLYAGLAAALEVPFMILWGYALKWVGKHIIIAASAVLYAIYLVLLSRSGSISDVLWLQLINGPATAALMSIPLSYMQDAIRGRVGLSTSLLDIVYLVSSVSAAAIFGAMTTVSKDYALVFAAAAGLSVLGAAVLFAAHRLMGAKPLPERS